MRRARWLVAAAAALAAAACSASPRVELRAHVPPPEGVAGVGSWVRGWAVALGPHRAVTPGHVVAGADRVLARQVWVDAGGMIRRRGRWRVATVAGARPSYPEPLVSLIVPGGELEPAPAGQVEPGDSGTPAYNEHGEVVGVLYGWATLRERDGRSFQGLLLVPVPRGH